MSDLVDCLLFLSQESPLGVDCALLKKVTYLVPGCQKVIVPNLFIASRKLRSRVIINIKFIQELLCPIE